MGLLGWGSERRVVGRLVGGGVMGGDFRREMWVGSNGRVL